MTNYCVGCNKPNQTINNPVSTMMGGKTPAMKGTCANCGKAMFKILPASAPSPAQVAPSIAPKPLPTFGMSAKVGGRPNNWPKKGA